LHSLPESALDAEVSLHGGFAVDRRPGCGHIYYGMPDCGLLRVSPDLTTQEIIDLPPTLKSINFHSTKLGEFDGQTHLFLPANNDAMVAILTLEGAVEFMLPKPEFDQYLSEGNDFKPTDTVLEGNRLFVADGYGANYIATADLSIRQWTGIFGGKTENAEEHGKFGTAHGMNRTPTGGHLAIADRPHSRIEIFTFEGHFAETQALPPGSRPCGIDYVKHGTRWYAAVGSLDAPEAGRPAPIYILDAATYHVISTIRPKEELDIQAVDHIHNVVWHEHKGQLFLICQSWNPGHYFVLELVG
jgi:hypothetical protein